MLASWKQGVAGLDGFVAVRASEGVEQGWRIIGCASSSGLVKPGKPSCPDTRLYIGAQVCTDSSGLVQTYRVSVGCLVGFGHSLGH